MANQAPTTCWRHWCGDTREGGQVLKLDVLKERQDLRNAEMAPRLLHEPLENGVTAVSDGPKCSCGVRGKLRVDLLNCGCPDFPKVGSDGGTSPPGSGVRRVLISLADAETGRESQKAPFTA